MLTIRKIIACEELNLNLINYDCTKPPSAYQKGGLFTMKQNNKIAEIIKEIKILHVYKYKWDDGIDIREIEYIPKSNVLEILNRVMNK